MIIMKCNISISITIAGDEKSHVAPIPSKTGVPRYIEFDNPMIRMNVSNDKIMELEVSENGKGNVNSPTIYSDELFT